MGHVQDDFEELHRRWMDFIFSAKVEVKEVLKENELLGLVR
jgi:hypothetical protein